ncbi:MAG: hypothetical protein IT162_19680 [Bryobacterales bacterium]|nr:hypothetical protein [Bryobacterales bacterium]
MKNARSLSAAALPLVALLALSSPVRLHAQASAINLAMELQGRTNLLAPGDPIIIRGTALTGGASGPTLVNTLAVKVDGKRCLLKSFSPTQLEVVLPYDLAPGTLPLVISNSGAAIVSSTLRIAKVAPNLLTNDWSAAGDGMIVRMQATPNMVETGGVVIEYPRASAAVPVIPGERVYALTTGLGTTNPATPSLQFPTAPARIAVPVTLSAGGRAMEDVAAFVEPEQYWPFFREVSRFISIQGWSRVYFTVPKDMPEGAHALRITADGVAGNTVVLHVGKRKPHVVAIATSTNTWGGVSPGTLLSIYGLHLGPSATGGFDSFKAGDVSVEMDGRPVAVLGVFEPQGQINVVTPMDLPASRRITLTVKTPLGNTNHPMFSYAVLPSVFKLPDPTDIKRSFAIATLANTVWLPLPDATATALGLPKDCAANQISPLSSCAQPVKAGDILQIYVTGMGRATSTGADPGPMIANGAIAPADGNPLYKIVAPVTVTIGDASAEVIFAGLAPGFAGLYQLNVRVPAAAKTGDAVTLEVASRLGERAISDKALIAVKAAN